MTLARPHLTNLTAGLLIGLAAVVTFGSGLGNQFVGDDFAQIVGNVPVHSLSHIPSFFAGSTFYQGTAGHLAGVYYRPLMTSAYAVLYRLAGPHAYAFHLLQLLLYAAAVLLLFLIYREFLRPGLALSLGLVFLVHPINSQAVYAIAALQEPLYFFFGALGLWLVMRLRARPAWGMAAASACFFVALLGKETGICFAAMAVCYAFMFNRRRALAIAAWTAGAVAAYLALKIPAVGLAANPGNAPIDHAGLAGRLLNVPALWVFYLGKVVFPWHIAHGYYWVVRSPSIGQFWLPLGLILIFGGLLLWAWRAVSYRSPRGGRVYAFFGLWLAAGLAVHSQIIPIDLTAALQWFLFPLAGLLGMAGVLFQTFALDLLLIPPWRRLALTVFAAVLLILAARSWVRGLDWSGTYMLAGRDLAISADDYPSANLLADRANQQRHYAQAQSLAARSVAILPTADNLDTLGTAEAGLGHCAAATRAFHRSLVLADTTFARRHLSSLAQSCGPPQTSVK